MSSRCRWDTAQSWTAATPSCCSRFDREGGDQLGGHASNEGFQRLNQKTFTIPGSASPLSIAWRSPAHLKPAPSRAARPTPASGQVPPAGSSAPCSTASILSAAGLRVWAAPGRRRPACPCWQALYRFADIAAGRLQFGDLGVDAVDDGLHSPQF